MFFKQFHLESLGHASYMVGSEQTGEALVLDVRQPQEWAAGHIKGALHISGGELPRRIDEVPKDRPVAVICGSGHRSSVSSSLLVRDGHTQITNVLGGMSAWKKAGLPVTDE